VSLRRAFLLLSFCATVAIAAAAQQPLTIDTERSTLTVHAYKSGLFSGFAHDHVVQGKVAKGSIRLGDAPAVELEIAASDLKVLDHELAADKRAEVQQRMLGPDVLDVERFPRILFRSTSIAAAGAGRWQVHGDLNLHGQTQPIAFEVTKSGESYAGRAMVKQRAFGIKPVSVAGGTVKVKDEVAVEFTIVPQSR
jgi:polyisoprenoid-binding protein YceI